MYGEYAEQGYLYLNVDPRETVRDSVVDLEFVVSEGAPSHVRKVSFTGNKGTREHVLRRELAIHEGDRFRRSALAAELRRAGFAVERITYANLALLPVAVAKRLAEARRGQHRKAELRTDFWLPPAPVNRALAALLMTENALIRRRLDLPAGLSLVALARVADGRP